LVPSQKPFPDVQEILIGHKLSMHKDINPNCMSSIFVCL